jgi:hypothetical protein
MWISSPFSLSVRGFRRLSSCGDFRLFAVTFFGVEIRTIACLRFLPQLREVDVGEEYDRYRNPASGKHVDGFEVCHRREGSQDEESDEQPRDVQHDVKDDPEGPTQHLVHG